MPFFPEQTEVRWVQQMRDDIAEAVATAKANIPPYPLVLCEQLGAHLDQGTLSHAWKQREPFFRGWWWYIGDTANGISPNNLCSLEEGYVPDNLDLTDIGYSGLWVARVNQPTDPIVWCSIPSMQCGRCSPGDTIDPGKERIRIGYSQDEVDRFVREGWGVVKRMIDEFGPYAMDRPAQDDL
jgi:hypothetical protein